MNKKCGCEYCRCTTPTWLKCVGLAFWDSSLHWCIPLPVEHNWDLHRHLLTWHNNIEGRFSHGLPPSRLHPFLIIRDLGGVSFCATTSRFNMVHGSFKRRTNRLKSGYTCNRYIPPVIMCSTLTRQQTKTVSYESIH